MKTVPYLICNTPGCCACVKFEYIEAQVLEHLYDRLGALLADVPIADDSKRYIAIHNGIKAEISKVLQQKDTLHELLEQKVYDVDTYRARMKAVTDNLDALQEQAAIAAAAVEKHKPLDRAEMINRIRSVLDIYQASDAKGRNMMLKSVVDHIDYFKEKKSKPQDFEIQLFYK
jgi:DNA integrity scanning protein DisA with diadenylate cyclase activity